MYLIRYENNLSSARRVGIQKGIMLGIAQGIISIVLYGGISIIFWYGPYLIRTECQNYSPGQFMVVCIDLVFEFVFFYYDRFSGVCF